MKPQDSDATIERFARAICWANGGRPDDTVEVNGLQDKRWKLHIVSAKASLEVFDRANRRWMVGMTKPMEEFKAATNLIEQGYEIYLPIIHVRIDGKMPEARTILRFPGYILISVASTEPHGPIDNTAGMDGSGGSALIMDGPENPATIRTSIIKTLRHIEHIELGRALTRKPTPRTDLMPGDLVRFIGEDHKHPAFGLEATYLEPRRRGRALIVLSNWREIEVAQNHLQKIERSAERKAA